MAELLLFNTFIYMAFGWHRLHEWEDKFVSYSNAAAQRILWKQACERSAFFA
ncbi:Hypothetical protein FKW44_004555 [Caligus rogercresseyi]|uniref:Uncharacterized protein n=1 Tax=Caligus rogercresseyi TaxID=217165 RepID=A0A7T8HMW7_CALRO|nr:Hypothetical protein FKW44_004555 [Caligus rogercresseyi]